MKKTIRFLLLSAAVAMLSTSALAGAWQVVGGSSYDDLATACANVPDGGTIQLVADGQSFPYDITITKSVTIDLNGKTVGMPSTAKKRCFTLATANKTLRITNGTISPSTGSKAALVLCNDDNATIVLEGITAAVKSTLATSASPETSFPYLHGIAGEIIVKDCKISGTADHCGPFLWLSTTSKGTIDGSTLDYSLCKQSGSGTTLAKCSPVCVGTSEAWLTLKNNCVLKPYPGSNIYFGMSTSGSLHGAEIQEGTYNFNPAAVVTYPGAAAWNAVRSDLQSKVHDNGDGTWTVGDVTPPAPATPTVVVGDVTVEYDEDSDWIKAKTSGGKTVEEVMGETDEATGLKGWQEYALGGTTEKPDIKSASKDSSGNAVFAVPAYAVDEASGITVTRKVKRTVGGATTETALPMDAATIVIDKSDLSAQNPVATYEVEMTFTDKSGNDASVLTAKAGVMYVAADAKLTIVPVAWEALGGGDIAAEDLIDVTDLAEGDKLHVYADGSYKTWRFNGSKQWEELKTLKATAPGEANLLSAGAASGTGIPRGAGVWLEREDATKPVHLLGGCAAATVVPAVSEGWNLLGNANTVALDLATAYPGAANGETVIVPTAGAPKRLIRRNGAWGYWKETKKTIGKVEATSTEWVSEAKIGVGEGFWYVK